MKRAVHICLLFILSAAAVHSQSLISEEIKPIHKDMEILEEYYPRTEGSLNETKTRNYLIRQISDMGLEYSELEYNLIDSLHSFSGGIEVLLPGKLDEELLVIIPLDHEQDADTENCGNVSIALGLHILRKYRDIQPSVGLHLVFLGGEHNSRPAVSTGTRNFLAEYFPEKPVAALYMDITGPSDTIEMHVSGKNISAPFWFIQRCDKALQQAGLFSKLMNNEIHAYRTGLSGENSIINSYLSEEIPGIYLYGKNSGQQIKPEEWFLKTIIFLDNFIQQNQKGFNSDWDKNYLYFKSRFFSYLVSETVYVVCILLFFCCILIYPLISRKRFMRNVQTLGYNGNYILFYIIGSVIISLLVKLFTELLIILRGTTAVVQDFPLLFFVFQISAVTFLIYLMISRIIPGPRNGTFYNALALLLLLTDILFIGFIDISFTYIFIWAFFWAFMFTIAKSTIAKRIYFVLSPVLLINTFNDFLSIESSELKNILFRNVFPGIFFWGLIVLPFVLLFFRLRMLSSKTSSSARVVFTGIISALLLICSLLILFLSPKNSNAEIWEYIQTGNQKRLIILKGEYPLNKNSVPAYFTRQNRYSYVYEEDFKFDDLKIEKSENRFLSRRKITFTVQAPAAPDTVSILLTTKNPIVIYNSRYPFTINPRNNSAQIIIGKNPPNPLVLDIVVPEDFDGSADFRIRYIKNPFDFQVDLDGYTLQHNVEIKSVLKL